MNRGSLGRVLRLPTPLIIASLVLAGCRTSLPSGGRERQPVEVLGAAIAFTGENRAECKLQLAVQNPQTTGGSATRITWELWVQRRWFAEGDQYFYQPLLPAGPTQFELALPIALRRAPASPGTVEVDVWIRGKLTTSLGGSEDQVPFERMLRAKAPASPLWEVVSEED
ncbi:MAG TPA: hypothetical protein VKE49_02005 [Myxococcaceae bacterium]|nr:hypothetical protein [Myxococcaceae bacterium]